MDTSQHQTDGSDGLEGRHEAVSIREPPSVDLPPTTLQNGPSKLHAVTDNNGSQPMIGMAHIDAAAADTDKPAEAASFPALSKDASAFPRIAEHALPSDGEDGGPATEGPFPRSTSPAFAVQRSRVAVYEEVGEKGICHLHKFWLYETASRYYVVGGDVMERKFTLLKIDRTADNGHLSICEDDIVYGKREMNQLLHTMDEGNKAAGGMKLIYSFWGLLGFVRFTGAYYMLLVTKRSAVAVIGGHYVYQIDATELISLSSSSTRSKMDRDPEEARFIGILNNLDLTRSFYFSYSYDITRTLQHNILRERQALAKGNPDNAPRDHNSMFVWNHHLLKPASAALRTTYEWCMPIIHGFVDQAKISNYGRSIYITIIARRSRFFAGARFLKRGANDLASHMCPGYVANDVETEQIVSQMLTTSFHAPGTGLFSNPNYTSYVQHRGSIPLYWTQDNTGVSPKPDIELNLVDPFYSAAALHFDNLFERYGSLVYVLNLVKSRERTPRESILLQEYGNAISYLNQFLPDDRKIRYKAWDMSRASKSQDQDVIGTLESIGEDIVNLTGIFHDGSCNFDDARVQNGVARTNCIDCLDRTNAAQFVIGKRALGYQLHALGIIDDPSIEYDTDAVNLFTHMFHDHGDTIAIQYGGSHLVNTMATYRKINQWSSHSRDMVESFKRYYNNSFLDKQRQEAYNLFLGNYIFAQGQPMLWDLSTDYYLHHADPRTWFKRERKSYIEWFNPIHLRGLQAPVASQLIASIARKPVSFYDEWWIEYYRPHQLSQFDRLLAIKMNSTYNYLPYNATKEGNYSLSPFRVRDGHEISSLGKSLTKKGVTTADPTTDSTQGTPPKPAHDAQHGILPGLVQPQTRESQPSQHNILKLPPSDGNDPKPASAERAKDKKCFKDKSGVTQWTLDQFVTNSLNPSVANIEAHEYQRYVNHPLNLPLVVSTEIPPNVNLEFSSYVNSTSADAVTNLHTTEDDLADYAEFLDIGEDPLTVTEADTAKKRYKAYRQWVKGKSLFKQRVDP